MSLTLAGCGHTPADATAPVADRFSAAAPSVAPVLPGSALPSVVRLAQAWSGVKTLSGHYELWEKDGSSTETVMADMWYEQPGRYRLNVSEATDALKRGSQSVFDTRTRQISSRPGGALSFVKLDGTLDDARTKSIRGYMLDQTDYATQMNLLLSNAARLREVPSRAAGITLELANPGLAGIDALRALIDPQKGLPMYVEMASHGQVVHTRKFTTLNVNPAIPTGKFVL